VVNTFDHQRDAYTQGLQFVDGVMWEGTGEYGSSRLQYTDIATGKSTVVATLPKEQFGEGITLLGDRIYQLTWQNGVMHIYDRKNFNRLQTKRYKGEGWGLTTDGQWLYMSDGTPDIRVLDPQTLEVKRRIGVICNGESLLYLNELEWIDGKIWANVYTLNQIVIINPESGVVEKIVNLEGLLPESEYTATTDVLNGIAYDKDNNRIFVTGKNWSKMFEIRLL
jgi:glutamine cyclotransferase